MTADTKVLPAEIMECNGHTRYHVKENGHSTQLEGHLQKLYPRQKVKMYMGPKKRKVRIKTTAAMTKSPITCS